MNPHDIFGIDSPEAFKSKALEVFRLQHEQIPVYRQFCDYLKVDAKQVRQLEEIPFLPIEIFKSHQILAKGHKPLITFTSSGTTGSVTSKHHLSDLSWYQQSFTKGFELFYGAPQDFVILGLLPAYLERQSSSLVYMVDQLIQASQQPESGFYLDDLTALRAQIEQLEAQGRKYLLIGVSFALLDLAQMGPLAIEHGIIMETGGMKGRRKELIRSQLHQLLQQAFGEVKIHSEYGMTELLSQAYSKGDGTFNCPPWMQILIRQTNDPFNYIKRQTGGINVIDLANINSCAFIATQDLGKQHSKNSFEILGRFDHSDVRGCNLMVL